MVRIELSDNNILEKHFLDVKLLIKNRIKNILKNGIKYNDATIKISNNILYIELEIYLLKLQTEAFLKKYILASPTELLDIAEEIIVQNPAFIDSTTFENFVLRNIFISHCYKEFDKLNFITKIGIDTCPYCNRNYIYALTKTQKIKPQVDHFLPKSKYPFLAISYYNLVPCCQTCNGFGTKEENDPIIKQIASPYLIKKSDFNFTYSIKSIDFLNPLTNKPKISVELSKFIKGNKDVFKLDRLYSKHTDHVLELIIKSKLQYSAHYRTYLKSYKHFQFSDTEIDRMILGNYSTEEEIHKRPLAKLYQDIGKELGLIL